MVTVELESHFCSDYVKKHSKDAVCAKEGKVDSLTEDICG